MKATATRGANATGIHEMQDSHLCACHHEGIWDAFRARRRGVCLDQSRRPRHGAHADAETAVADVIVVVALRAWIGDIQFQSEMRSRYFARIHSRIPSTSPWLPAMHTMLFFVDGTFAPLCDCAPKSFFA